jgi:hypothetical protein
MELMLFAMELDAFLEVYDDYATLILLKPDDEDDDDYYEITLSLEDAEKIIEMFCCKEI